MTDMSLLGRLKRVCWYGYRQARWGMRTHPYRAHDALESAYEDALYWYDGDEPPDADAPDVERFAYSQRQHLEDLMDALEYEDGRFDGTLPPKRRDDP